MNNLIVLIPDTTSAAILAQIADETYPHAQLIKDRVAFGRPYSAAQAFSFLTEDMDAARALLTDHPEVALIGMWDYTTGKQIAPFNKALYMNIMPDDVTWNEDGTEASRTRPAELKQVHIWEGQADRHWV